MMSSCLSSGNRFNFGERLVARADILLAYNGSSRSIIASLLPNSVFGNFVSKLSIQKLRFATDTNCNWRCCHTLRTLLATKHRVIMSATYQSHVSASTPSVGGLIPFFGLPCILVSLYVSVAKKIACPTCD
jgi:hypothetical protein